MHEGKPSHHFKAWRHTYYSRYACHVPCVGLRFWPKFKRSPLLCSHKHVPCERKHILSNGWQFPAPCTSHLYYKFCIFMERRQGRTSTCQISPTSRTTATAATTAGGTWWHFTILHGLNMLQVHVWFEEIWVRGLIDKILHFSLYAIEHIACQ